MLRPGSASFVVLLGFIFACGALATDLFAPAQPSIAEDLATSVLGAQLIMSVFFVGNAIAQLLFGPLSDRFGRKPVLMAGLWLYALATLACSLASSIEMLVGLRFVQGLAAATGTVVARAVARDHFQGRELGQVMAYMSLTLSLSPVLLPPLGGLLTTAYGWQASFVFLTLLAASIALTTQVGLKESARGLDEAALNPSRLLSNFVELIRHPTFFGFMVTGTLCFAGMFTFVTNSSFVFVGSLGTSTSAFGLYLGIASLGYTFGTFSGGRLVTTVGGAVLITAGAAICAVSGLIASLVTWLGAASVPTLLLPMIGYMFGSGLVFPQCLAGALHPFPKMAGTASALMGFAVMISASVVSGLVGAAYTGTAAAMVATIALMGVSTFLFFTLVVRRRAAEQGQPG